MSFLNFIILSSGTSFFIFSINSISLLIKSSSSNSKSLNKFEFICSSIKLLKFFISLILEVIFISYLINDSNSMLIILQLKIYPFLKSCILLSVFSNFKYAGINLFLSNILHIIVLFSSSIFSVIAVFIELFLNDLESFNNIKNISLYDWLI